MGIRATNAALKAAANRRYRAASREIQKLDERLIRFERTLCNRLYRVAIDGDFQDIVSEVDRATDDVTVMIGRTMERVINQTQRQAIKDAREIVPEDCYDEEVDAQARKRGPGALRIARKVRTRLPADNRPALGGRLSRSQRDMLPDLLSLEEKQRVVLRRLMDDEKFRIITTSFVDGQRRTWDRRVVAISKRLGPRNFGRMLAGVIDGGAKRSEIEQLVCEFATRLVNQARVIGRTESYRVYRLTDDTIFRRFDACLSAFQRLSVGDERVRPLHVQLHGRIYRKREDGRFTDSRGREMSVPPDAPNCRCWLVPIFSKPRATEGDDDDWPTERIDTEREYSREYRAECREGSSCCGVL